MNGKKKVRLLNPSKCKEPDILRYLDIANSIQMSILIGEYQPGQRLPSVRMVASQYDVCLATALKAFAQAERSGLVVTNRSGRRFVCENREAIHDAKAQCIARQVSTFIKGLRSMALSNDEIIDLVSTILDYPE